MQEQVIVDHKPYSFLFAVSECIDFSCHCHLLKQCSVVFLLAFIYGISDFLAPENMYMSKSSTA